MTRWIVGNLDCETAFARADAAERAARGLPAPSPRDPRFAPHPAVLESISALATLLRAFAAEGDIIWTPRPVDPSRMARVEGLPSPRLESGPFPGAGGASILAWAETEDVERARRGAAAPAASEAWPFPTARAARMANDRRFFLETAESLGLALPGSRLIGSVPELERHLAGGGAGASRDESWVLKAPFSASGRLRLRGRGRAVSAGDGRRAARLLDLFGEALFEPWMDRTADLGCCGIIGEAGRIRVLPPHGLRVGPGGVFRGIGVDPARSVSEDKARLEETAREVGRRLIALGYSGPFGIDAWIHRGLDGSSRLHPLGEINARMSFGLVARALVEKLRVSSALPAAGAADLSVGKAADLEVRRRDAPGRLIPILLPGGRDGLAAWIEEAP